MLLYFTQCVLDCVRALSWFEILFEVQTGWSLFKKCSTNILPLQSHRSLKESFCLVAPVCCLSTLLYYRLLFFLCHWCLSEAQCISCNMRLKISFKFGTISPYYYQNTWFHHKLGCCISDLCYQQILPFVSLTQTYQHWTFLNSEWCDLILSSSDIFSLSLTCCLWSLLFSGPCRD